MAEFTPYLKATLSKYLDLQLSTSGDVTITSRIEETRDSITRSVVATFESGELDEYIEQGVSLASLVRGVASDLYKDIVSSVTPIPSSKGLVEGYLLALSDYRKGSSAIKGTSKKKGRKTSKEPDKLIDKAKAGSLLNSNSRYQSIFSLKNFIETQMKANVAAEMSGNPSALKNRTGRFFNSIALDRIAVSPKAQQVSLYFSYLYYPYQVFEPGLPSKHPNKTALATEGRNPRRLISVNLREAAVKILNSRYRLKIIQSGGLA